MLITLFMNWFIFYKQEVIKSLSHSFVQTLTWRLRICDSFLDVNLVGKELKKPKEIVDSFFTLFLLLWAPAYSYHYQN